MKFLYIKERLCSMKVSRERLQIIGKMIGILREEKRQNKQNSWTQIRFCENICSPNTLKSIESGKVGRSDAIYEQLLAKLDLKYGEFPVIDEAIQNIIDELYEAIEYFDKDRINKLTNKALKVLEQVKMYIYYSELHDIMSDINNYYVNISPIYVKKAEHYLETMKLFPIEMRDILKLLIFAGVKLECTSNVELYEQYVNKLDIKNTNLPCFKINLLHYYHIKNERFKIIELIKELEEVFIKENNIIRLLGVYNADLSSLSVIDNTLRDLYQKKVLNIIATHDIPIVQKSETYANIAFGYYNQHDYKDALGYLYKCIEDGCKDLLGSYLIIADCQNHLNMHIDVPELDKESLRKYSREIRSIYNYFLMYKGEEVPNTFKQKILIKKIAPLLEDEWIIEVFRFELNKLVKETNSYKDLYLFEQIVKKNIDK